MSEQNQVLEPLKWRYATKRFDATKKITKGDWQTLEQVINFAPTSYGLQAFKAILVENPDLRKKLRTCSFNQSQVEDASHFVVLAAATKVTEKDIDLYMERISQVRGTPASVLTDFRKVMVGDLVNSRTDSEVKIWAAKQTYIVMGMLLMAAAELSIDACPMEGIEPAKYDEILGLAGSGFSTVSAVALGYRHAEDIFGKMKKVRKSRDELFVSL